VRRETAALQDFDRVFVRLHRYVPGPLMLTSHE